MSVVVNINQDSQQTKKIGLKFLDSWTASHNQYYGIPDAAYVLDTYKGEEDIRNQLFVLFDQKRYGRGMSFFVDENYNVEVVLNLPATKTDIEMFYKFIYDFCKNFGLDSFDQEDESVTLEEIEGLKERMISFNQNIIKTNLKTGLTIFGCIYPIVLENEFMQKLESMDDEVACGCFEEYLDQKQKLDCYFAKPLLYKLPDEGKICAKYALTEDVPSIFPMEKYLPFGYNQNLKDEINDWKVLLVENHNDKLEAREELDYDTFCSLIDINSYPKFDAKHVILTFNKEMLSRMESNKMGQTQPNKNSWLDDVKQLFKRKK